MTPQRWYAIAATLMLAVGPGLAFVQAADLGRIVNGTCTIEDDIAPIDEIALPPEDIPPILADPLVPAGSIAVVSTDTGIALEIPGWTEDDSPSAGFAAYINGTGASGAADDAACVIMGPGVLRSADTFDVVAGEALVLTYDVQEVRDDADENDILDFCPAVRAEDCADRGHVRGDSVVALEFYTLAGTSPSQLETHCDSYVDYFDNGIRDGSDLCINGEWISVTVRNNDPAFECASISDLSCTKYDGVLCNHPVRNDPSCGNPPVEIPNPLLVPTGATHARLLLGGSLAKDVDVLTATGVSSPTSLTFFDNVNVDNP